jgi:outer membrane lipoprotein-sorting protein
MIRRVLLAAALASFGTPGGAQTLDDVLARHYDALGGIERIKAVKSMRLTGDLTVAPGVTAPFTLELARPAKVRMEFTFQGLTGVQAFDGQNAWLVMPFIGKADPEPMPPDEARDFAGLADMEGVLVGYASKGHVVELVGQEPVAGRDAYKLKVTMKGGGVRYVYLATDSLLEVRSERTRTIRGETIQFESRSGDYRAVGGLMIPHAVETGPAGGQTRQTMRVSKVELDVPIDDARFTMPPAARRRP